MHTLQTKKFFKFFLSFHFLFSSGIYFVGKEISFLLLYSHLQLRETHKDTPDKKEEVVGGALNKKFLSWLPPLQQLSRVFFSLLAESTHNTHKTSDHCKFFSGATWLRYKSPYFELFSGNTPGCVSKGRVSLPAPQQPR